MMTSVVHPPRAAPALGYLHSSHNDIEIFVEDSSAPNIWVKLLKNFLPNAVKLNSVNILGSRENVLAACRADQVDDGRKKIYIIDADLDIMKGLPKPKLKHLYRLRAYCVENYLINNLSLVDLATTFDTDISATDADAKLDYDGWILQNEPALRSLFICYAVTHILVNSQQTVGYSVHLLLDGGSTRKNLCRVKSGVRIRELYRKVIDEHSGVITREVYSEINSRVARLNCTQYVSAKDYILPQIYQLMKTHFKLNVGVKQFKVLLASKVDSKTDPYLTRRLKRICS